MSKQTDNVATTTENTGAKRPTRKQFAVARRLASQTGNDIPQAAVHNRRVMGGFIAANIPAAV